ncbi:MAG: ThuA domain-containing protein [Phycisphaerales bacterium]|nr:ThuA domain-containing protein [Phycisphaerales bacterium]
MLTLCLGAVLSLPSSPIDVVVFTRTEGFSHGNIARGVEVLQEMAQGRWNLKVTDDSADLGSDNLEEVEVVVFFNTTMDVLDKPEEASFQRWLEAGGGWVGIHAAADTEYEWPFYGALLGGAYFVDHPHIQEATIRLEDPSHPSVRHLLTNNTNEKPPVWTRTDEWFNYRVSPRAAVHVVASLDESTYEGGSMGDDHPIVWTTAPGKGAGIYTGLGHTNESWDEPAFRSHIAGAIQWASSGGWIPLGNLAGGGWAEHRGWSDVGSATAIDRKLKTTPGTGVLVNGIGGHAGELLSDATFGDCDLHIEFMVPAGSNSGVYIQGRYEIQILDSHGVESPASSDCGGIYERWDEERTPKGWQGHSPTVNAAALPGVWQSYDIRFRAPRFDAQGRKVSNAVMERVMHNGQLIHEDVELFGPTRGGLEPEAMTGPIRLQGDHGPVAYRNIRIRRL